MIELIVLILLLDLISGIVHWAEDTFWNESTPIIGKWLVIPNELHHRDPSAFVKNTWLQSSWDLLLVGLIVLGIAAMLGEMTWQLLVIFLVGVNANQIHKWNHSPLNDVPKIILTLQNIKLLQNRNHHLSHHSGEKNTAYCVITPFVNPIMDRLGFFRLLDQIFLKLIHSSRREDLPHNG